MLNGWLWSRFALRLPQLELRRLRRIEFFPPPPDLETTRSICIGTKSRTIGDALMLSTLPGKLKARYPGLRVYTYPRGFNPVVFAGNPEVDGIQWLPEALHGDDCNWGSGHLIELKERYFGLEPASRPAPELHLLPGERDRARGFLGDSELPWIAIHPWGKTRSAVASSAFWAELVSRHRGKFAFFQVGLEGQERIPGCKAYLLLPPKPYAQARRLFAAISLAHGFIGVDSGPMHVARAFGLPALILTDQGIDATAIFSRRRESPYFLQQNRLFCFLYEENLHVDVRLNAAEAILDRAGSFLASGAPGLFFRA